MPHRQFLPAIVLLLSVALGNAADDAYGDPVPEGAKFRLGTARLRSLGSGNPTAITADGKLLVGALPNNESGFFDFSGKLVRSVRIEGGFGTVMDIAADGKRAASGSFQSAFVWDTESGKVVAKVARAVPSGDHGVSLSADGKRLAVGGVKRFDEKDKTKLPGAVVWDVEQDKELVALPATQNETVFVAMSPDSKRVATWGYHYDREAKEPLKAEVDPARLIQLWDAGTGKETGKVRLANSYGQIVVAFSPDGTLAAVASGDGSVQMIDANTGETKTTLLGRSRQGKKLTFSPDGKTLAAAGEDSSVQRWSMPSGERIDLTEPHTQLPPSGLAFSGNDRMVVWGSRGWATVAWEVPSGKLLTPPGGHAAPLSSAAIVANGKEYLTASTDGAIIRWDAATGKELDTIRLKIPGLNYGSGYVNSPVRLSFDGTMAMASEGGSGSGLYSLPGGNQQFVIPGDNNRESRTTFSSDGTKAIQLLTSYDAKKNPPRVAAWDLKFARKLGSIELPPLGQVAADLSPDGKTIITAGVRQDEKGGNSEFVVNSWETATGKKLGEFKDVAGFGSVYVAATPDNKTAVVTSPKGGTLLLDFTTGTKVRDLGVGMLRPASSPVVSPDGKIVAIPLSQNFGPKPTSSVLLIELATGDVIQTLAGIGGSTTAIVFSTDGKTVITGGTDTTSLVWTGKAK